MKTSNYILKTMENLQTNVALLTAIKRELICKLPDKEYDNISDKMAVKELRRPSLALDDFMKTSEEMYNYLEQLLLTCDKPY